MQQTRIITRGDDSGSCHSANRAILDAFQQGVLRNTSLMASAPTFNEAASLYRDVQGLCIGLHATLTDEWHTSRWGPVLGAEAVPSLVMSDGTFFKSTQALWQNQPDFDEILAELKAQLDLMRQAGLQVAYMDTHMGFDWFDGLRPCLKAFADAEGLVYQPSGIARLPEARGVFADPIEHLLARFDATTPGETYLIVAHPCYNEPEVQQMTYGDKAPGEIARERDWERRVFMDERVVEYYEAHNFVPIRFTEI